MKKDLFGDEVKAQDSQDFARLFEASMGQSRQSFNTGDKVRGEVLIIGKEDVSISLTAQQDAFISKKEFVNSEGQLTIKVGDMIEAYVQKYSDGVLQLTLKASNKALAESLEDAFDFGTAIEGKVEEVVNGGVRVKIFSKLAFCPLSQLDSRPVTDVASYVGKKMNFIITKFEEGGRNIVVSHRKFLDEQKQESLSHFLSDVKEGATVSGVVTKFESFGAFAEIAPGIEGLIHISEISWSHIKHPEEALTIGQSVTLKVLKIEDLGERVKISLSKKQMDQDPWVAAEKLFQVGQVVTGKVTRLTGFGAFVEVESGIEGLIPLSEMSYDKRVLKADECVRAGEAVAVQVKQINVKDQRMTLSLRDAEGASPEMIRQSQSAQTSGGGLGTFADLFKNLKK